MLVCKVKELNVLSFQNDDAIPEPTYIFIKRIFAEMSKEPRRDRSYVDIVRCVPNRCVKKLAVRISRADEIA